MDPTASNGKQDQRDSFLSNIKESIGSRGICFLYPVSTGSFLKVALPCVLHVKETFKERDGSNITLISKLAS